MKNNSGFFLSDDEGGVYDGTSYDGPPALCEPRYPQFVWSDAMIRGYRDDKSQSLDHPAHSSRRDAFQPGYGACDCLQSGPLGKLDPEGIVAFFPSDHYFFDDASFIRDLDFRLHSGCIPARDGGPAGYSTRRTGSRVRLDRRHQIGRPGADLTV